MFRISEFLSDWSLHILGGKKYEIWEKDSFTLQTVAIRNKKLALELEKECNKMGGYLTFSEFLNIDQFGKNGYHNTHSYHGFTKNYNNWSQIIFNYLQEKNIKNVIEMGPGDENLAERLFTIGQKNKYKFFWYAVELEDNFREKIKKRFSTKRYKPFLGGIEKNISGLPHFNKAVIISSFCLDSIPPEILINSSQKMGPPDTVLGMRIKDGIVSEFILSKEELKKKNMDITDYVFSKNNISYNLKALRLPPMKRLYLLSNSYAELFKTMQKVDEQSVFIIDEFRVTLKDILHSDHYLAPLQLNKHNRYSFNPGTSYRRAGELLYYYPLFLSLTLSFLEACGLNVSCDVEPKMVAALLNKDFIPDRKVSRYLCYGITASGMLKVPKKISLAFSP